MTTRLDNVLRREILADGKAYVVTLTPIGLKVAAKGRRNGIELTWDALVDGEAALAVALNASLRRLSAPTPRRGRAARAARR